MSNYKSRLSSPKLSLFKSEIDSSIFNIGKCGKVFSLTSSHASKGPTLISIGSTSGSAVASLLASIASRFSDSYSTGSAFSLCEDEDDDEDDDDFFSGSGSASVTAAASWLSLLFSCCSTSYTISSC